MFGAYGASWRPVEPHPVDQYRCSRNQSHSSSGGDGPIKLLQDARGPATAVLRPAHFHGWDRPRDGSPAFERATCFKELTLAEQHPPSSRHSCSHPKQWGPGLQSRSRSLGNPDFDSDSDFESDSDSISDSDSDEPALRRISLRPRIRLGIDSGQLFYARTTSSKL